MDEERSVGRDLRDRRTRSFYPAWPPQLRLDPPQNLVIATCEDVGDPHLERLLDGRIWLDPGHRQRPRARSG